MLTARTWSPPVWRGSGQVRGEQTDGAIKLAQLRLTLPDLALMLADISLDLGAFCQPAGYDGGFFHAPGLAETAQGRLVPVVVVAT